MSTVGGLAPPTHFSGEGNVRTGMLHNHNAAKSLFVGFHAREKVLCLMCPFVRSNTDVDHFCLCRAETVYATEVLFTRVAPPRLIVCVRWHHHVSHSLSGKPVCDTAFCTETPLLQGTGTGEQVAICITTRRYAGNSLPLGRMQLECLY